MVNFTMIKGQISCILGHLVNDYKMRSLKSDRLFWWRDGIWQQSMSACGISIIALQACDPLMFAKIEEGYYTKGILYYPEHGIIIIINPAYGPSRIVLHAGCSTTINDGRSRFSLAYFVLDYRTYFVV